MPLDLQYGVRLPRIPSTEAPQSLVLLHGYGSNELDLLGLGDALDPHLYIVSLRAPRQSGPQAYAWFDLDWTESGPIPNADQALDAREGLIEFLRSIPTRFNVRERIILGGFSQGAMMSLGVAMGAPGILDGLLMMSGRVLPAFVPDPIDQRLDGLSALVQHGLQDPILNYHGSREAAALLAEFGASVRHLEYPMGHEVSQQSLADARDWLRDAT